MREARYKIRSVKFAPGRQLNRDVFLELPKNGKFIRLAYQGSELSQALLERIWRQGVDYLYVSGAPGEALEAVESTVFSTEQDTDTAPPSPAALARPDSELPSKPSLPTAQETVGHIGPDSGLPENRITREAEDTPSKAFDAEIQESSLSSAIPSNSESSLEPEIIAGTPAENTELSRISGLVDSIDNALILVCGQHDALAETLTSARRAIQAAKGSSDISIELLTSLHSARITCLANAEKLSPESEQALALNQLVIAVDSAIGPEKIDDTLPRRESPPILPDSLTSGPTLAGIATVQAAPLSDLLNSEANESGLEPFQLGAQQSKKAIEPKPAADLTGVTEKNKIREKSFARLATRLAISLGYSAPEYLSDLALASIIKNSQKDGISVENFPDSPICKFVIAGAGQPAHSPFQDAKNILEFTSFLHMSQESKTSSDASTSSKGLREQIERFQEHHNTIDNWTLSAWTSITLEHSTPLIESLCNRSTADAVKKAHGSGTARAEMV